MPNGLQSRWARCAVAAAALGFVLSGSAAAASLRGRVVDSSGNPVVGAGVRVWQKLVRADGQGVDDLPIQFPDGETLVTNADGRFQSPELATDAFAYAIVEADGFMAWRSGWIEIIDGEAAADAGDIALRRLVNVSGRVVDRAGRPVAGVIVFNAGDGERRVEAASDAAGRFELKQVPEGSIFLFAEKAGFRFTGMLFEGQGEARISLAGSGEHIEPLKSLPPLLSPEEELALAHKLLDPYLDALEHTGSDGEKLWALDTLVSIDPLEANERATRVKLNAPNLRRLFQGLSNERLIAHRGELPWDDVLTILQSSDDQLSLVYELCEATRHMGDEDAERRFQWLDEALLHARRVEGAAFKARALAWIAERLIDLGRNEAAESSVREAEKIAEPLPREDRDSRQAFGFLACALARSEAARARWWLERIDEAIDYEDFGGRLALKLLPDEAALAEEVSSRAVQRRSLRREPFREVLYDWQRCHAANLGYQMAKVDLPRALRLARAEKQPAMHIRMLGAAALAQSQTDLAAGRDLLQRILNDELPRIGAPEAGSVWRADPEITAAWLLPIAERIDPELARECLWRALALRPPRPRVGPLDAEANLSDAGLAKMLTRYDRTLARAVLDPLARRTTELTAPSGTRSRDRQTLNVAHAAASAAQEVVVAAAHIDPRWAAELLDCVPDGAGTPLRPRNHALGAIVGVLGLQGEERWSSDDALSAEFWNPE